MCCEGNFAEKIRQGFHVFCWVHVTGTMLESWKGILSANVLVARTLSGLSIPAMSRSSLTLRKY